MRLKRITLDWDFKNPFKIFFYLNKILKANLKEIIIKPSRKKGYHVFVWCYEKGKTKTLRLRWGDDEGRVFMDSTHRHFKQTLFSKKIKVKGGKRWLRQLKRMLNISG